MPVRILVAFVANDGLYDVGEIRQMPDGVDWVAAGLAEAVEEASIPARPERAEGRETAVAAGYETATAMETGVWMPDRLTAIKGIGHRTQEALYAFGVRTFQQLIEADAEALAAALDGSSAGQVRKWQADAVGFLG